MILQEFSHPFGNTRGPRWHSGEGDALRIGRSLVRIQMV